MCNTVIDAFGYARMVYSIVSRAESLLLMGMRISTRNSFGHCTREKTVVNSKLVYELRCIH